MKESNGSRGWEAFLSFSFFWLWLLFFLCRGERGSLNSCSCITLFCVNPAEDPTCSSPLSMFSLLSAPPPVPHALYWWVETTSGEEKGREKSEWGWSGSVLTTSSLRKISGCESQIHATICEEGDQVFLSSFLIITNLTVCSSQDSYCVAMFLLLCSCVIRVCLPPCVYLSLSLFLSDSS